MTKTNNKVMTTREITARFNELAKEEKMKKAENKSPQNKSFKTTLLVTQTPGEVFDAIHCNNPSGKSSGQRRVA